VQVANGPVLAGPGPRPLAVKLSAAHDPIHMRFKRPPRAGLLFDLDTGQVLWRHNPTRLLPLASVTKMMSALLIAEHVPDGTRLRISRQAVRATGSKVGLLPRGKRVGVSALLYGLLLPSGNDAAVALAQGMSGSVPRFVEAMNEKAAELNLRCTRFSSPSGIVDTGNYSCPVDLAALARAVLDTPRLARIVTRRQAVLPFPIKGGRLYLYNHNPLLRMGYPGTLGIKTGFTDRAGKCIVAAARRGGRRLGVVLLHSPDIGKQAVQLLNRGFRYERKR
jgi:D-alanyl-D-alanine carboxypeptidase